MNKLNTQETIMAALGETKADIILRGGKIINVYTREIIENDVVITKDKIVHVGSESKDFEGEQTIIKEIDCVELSDIENHWAERGHFAEKSRCRRSVRAISLLWDARMWRVLS